MTVLPVNVRYAVRVLTPSGTVAGQITTYRKLSLAKRFNAPSNWSIELDADDPLAATLTTPKYGISVARIVYSALTGKVVTSRVEMAGPMKGISRQMAGNTLIVSGRDFMVDLSNEEAWPVTTEPYSPYIVATLANRYYKLGDVAGTTVVDSGLNPQNGTIVGTHYTRGVPSLIDNAGLATAITATDTYITLPTTGMGTGNGAWSMNCWVNVSAAPVGNNGVVMEFGNWGTTHAAPHIGITPSMFVYAGTFGGDTIPSTVLTVGRTYMLTATWDGTTLSCYVDSILSSTATPGALAVTAVGATLMNTNTHADPLLGTIQHACIWWGGALSLTEIQTMYTYGVNRFAAGAYDIQTGPAETVMKHYVNANLGPGALPDRQISGLAIATDSARGTTVTGNARFDKMMALDGTGLLQVLALAGGGLGFTLQQVAGVLTFDVYVPVDRTANIIFSEELGNLIDFTYSRDAPDPETGGNVVIIAGGNVGAARVIQIVPDQASIDTWGRVEFFQDARDTTDIPTMLNRANATLLSSQEVDQFTATLATTSQMTYGVDFDLGDKVTAVVDGTIFQDIIREVDITLAGGAEEVVTPMMGTPNAALVRSALLQYRRQALNANNVLKQLQKAT